MPMDPRGLVWQRKGSGWKADWAIAAATIPRGLVTRVGKASNYERVPQDRHGRFSTEIFERYQRSEKALVAALTQMFIQGVSTRKVRAISEELCGHSFSASAISEINKKLDSEPPCPSVYWSGCSRIFG